MRTRLFMRNGQRDLPLGSVLLILAALCIAALSGWLTAVSSTLYVALAIFFLFLGFLVLRWIVLNPEWTLALLYVGMFFWILLPSQLNELISGFRTPIVLAAAGLAYFLNVHLVQRRWQPVKSDKLEFSLLLFTTFLALSLIWSNNRAYGLWKVALFAGMSSGVFVLVRRYYINFPQRLPVLIHAVALTSMLPLGVFVWATLVTDGWAGFLPTATFETKRRLFLSSFATYEGLADALMLSAPCLLACAFMAHARRTRLGYYVLLTLCLYTLFLLGQRAPIAAVLLGISVIYIGVHSRVYNHPMIPRVLVVAILALLLIFGQFEMNPRLINRSLADEMSVVNRLLVYKVSFMAFMESPVIGHGLGGYATYQDRYGDAVGLIPAIPTGGQLSFEINRGFAHNIFMETLAETGLVGLILLLIVFSRIMRYSLSAWTDLISSWVGVQTRVIITVGLSTVLMRLMIGLVSRDLGTFAVGLWLGILVAATTVAGTRHKVGLSSGKVQT